MEGFREIMFIGIPLKSKKVSSDWSRVTELFNNTLRSVFNQIDPNFKVFVACHEIPETPYGDDPRLEFLPVDFAPPRWRVERNVDRYRKREVIASRVRQEGGGYIMLLDADDLVSNRLVKFVHDDQAPYGYVVQKGWELNYERRKISRAPAFHRLCGSCAIINWDEEDLPRFPSAPESCRFRDFIDNNNHPAWASASASQGRPLQPLPFRGVIYVWNNGENFSVAKGNVGARRRLLRFLMPSNRLSAKIIEEFALQV